MIATHAAAGLLAAVVLLGGGAAQGCTLPSAGGWLQQGEGPVRLAWRMPRVVVGEMFALQIAVCPAGARLVAVDATMPEHRHGMNYAVRLSPLSEGRWRADGLLWHMSGHWELRFDVEAGGVTHTLRQRVDLP